MKSCRLDTEAELMCLRDSSGLQSTTHTALAELVETSEVEKVAREGAAVRAEPAVGKAGAVDEVMVVAAVESLAAWVVAHKVVRLGGMALAVVEKGGKTAGGRMVAVMAGVVLVAVPAEEVMVTTAAVMEGAVVMEGRVVATALRTCMSNRSCTSYDPSVRASMRTCCRRRRCCKLGTRTGHCGPYHTPCT